VEAYSHLSRLASPRPLPHPPSLIHYRTCLKLPGLRYDHHHRHHNVHDLGKHRCQTNEFSQGFAPNKDRYKEHAVWYEHCTLAQLVGCGLPSEPSTIGLGTLSAAASHPPSSPVNFKVPFAEARLPFPEMSEMCMTCVSQINRHTYWTLCLKFQPRKPTESLGTQIVSDRKFRKLL
jgi:hypothetical protein